MSLLKNSIQSRCKFNSEKLDFPEGALNIKVLTSEKIKEKIKFLFQDVYEQIDQGKIPQILVPIKKRENIIYDKDGNHFLGQKTYPYSLGSKSNIFLRILHIANIVNELISKNSYAPKREVFYTNKKLFKKQSFSDSAIDDLAVLLQTRRICLNIVASTKGTCAGLLNFRLNDEIMNLESFGASGWKITPFINNIEITSSDAQFILVIEKNATMDHLSQIKFWKKVPCIILTAKGQPDYTTREFLKLLISKLKIPAFGLFDSDPWGISMALNYARGNILSAHETPWLTVNNFYWLGVMTKDLKTYKIPESLFIKMSKSDKNKINNMIKNLEIKNNQNLRKQLDLMKTFKKKIELQVFSKHNIGFLSNYIIEKIENGDFIKL